MWILSTTALMVGVWIWVYATDDGLNRVAAKFYLDGDLALLPDTGKCIPEYPVITI